MSEIRKRLGRSLPTKKQPATTVPRKHYRLRGTMPKRKKPHLRRLYLYYCYRLGVFQKHPQASRKIHFLLREDLRHLNNYTQEIRLLHTYRLDTDVQLSAFLERREEEIKGADPAAQCGSTPSVTGKQNRRRLLQFSLKLTVLRVK